TAAAMAGSLSLAQAAAQEAQVFRAADPPTNAMWVDSLDLSRAPIRRARGRSGQPPPAPLKLNLGGVEYPHGVPLQANGEIVIDLKGRAVRFSSIVGIDDEHKTGAGSVTFDVWVDGRHAADSGVMKSGDQPKPLSVDLTGAKRLMLTVGDAGDRSADDSA